MRILQAIAVLVAAGVVGGLVAGRASSEPSASSSVSELSVSVNGQQRQYVLMAPSDRPPNGAPLVVALHGLLSSSAELRQASALDRYGQAHGLLVAYPEAGAGGAWNAGACCGEAAGRVDDVAFVDAVIDDVADRYTVDPARVYVVGFSNGGMLALRYACERSGRVAAVAAVAASVEAEGCPPPESVSALFIHGDADEVHPLTGGRGVQLPLRFSSTVDNAEQWATELGCTAQIEDDPPGAQVRTWPTCPERTAVVLEVIAGGAHRWPPPATRTVVDFLLSHPQR